MWTVVVSEQILQLLVVVVVAVVVVVVVVVVLVLVVVVVLVFSKYFSSRKRISKIYKIGKGVVLIKMNHNPLTFLEYNNIYILMKLKEIKQDIHTKSKRKC